MSPMAIPVVDQLAKACAYALQWLATLVGGNYGLAIILLTVLMRIVLLPLSIKQTKSMIAMQRLQPQLKEIQKKYKDDREKQGQEMMKLYKDNKVSPLGGCLPLLLQLPLLFAVFEVLRSLSPETVIKKGMKPKPSKYMYIFTANQTVAQFKANLNFLGMNITYSGAKLWSGGQYVQVVGLVLLTVVTGYVTAKMMTTDPKQAKMMALMPLMMGVFAWILPAGVTIYLIVTNIFTLVQQYIQLERDGFYDEKLASLRKLGDQAKWHQALYLRLMTTGTKMMLAVHLRPELKTRVQGKKKVSDGKSKAGGAKAKGTSASSESPEKGKPTSGAAKATERSGGKSSSQGKKEKKESMTATSGKTKSKGKNTQKDYPAKKKSSGKK